MRAIFGEAAAGAPSQRGRHRASHRHADYSTEHGEMRSEETPRLVQGISEVAAGQAEPVARA